MNHKTLAKLATLILKESTLRKQCQAIRQQQKAIAEIRSTSEDGTSLTIDLPLGEFLSLFPDITPTLSTWEHGDGSPNQIAMHYGPVLAGFSVGPMAISVEAWTPWTAVKAPAAQAA